VNREEAVELLQRDPAIANNLLKAEIYDFYGSAALPTYLPYHKSIELKKPK